MLLTAVAALLINIIPGIGLSWSASCQPPQGRSLRIGCTTKCDEPYGQTYIAALMSAAKDLWRLDKPEKAIEIVKLNLEIKNPPDGYAQALSSLRLDALISPGGFDINPDFFELPPRMPAEGREQLMARLVELHECYGNGGKFKCDADGKPLMDAQGNPILSNNPTYERPAPNNPGGPEKPLYTERDKHESKIMHAYFQDDRFKTMPLLAVCYGLQMLAVSRGAPLVVDIPTQLKIPARRSSPPRGTPSTGLDEIHFVDKSCALYGKPGLGAAFEGFKNHHQAVDLEFLRKHGQWLPRLKVCATSNEDRILEILETTDRPAVGIQFHAERSSSGISNAVYGWLLEQACVASQSREHRPRRADLGPARNPARAASVSFD